MVCVLFLPSHFPSIFTFFFIFIRSCCWYFKIPIKSLFTSPDPDIPGVIVVIMVCLVDKPFTILRRHLHSNLQLYIETDWILRKLIILQLIMIFLCLSTSFNLITIIQLLTNHALSLDTRSLSLYYHLIVMMRRDCAMQFSLVTSDK